MIERIHLKFENNLISYNTNNNNIEFNNENKITQNDEYINNNIKFFPKTRYYGSKKRVLIWIYDNLKHLNFNTVLDGFGGTGSVSLLFSLMNKDVTYNDILSSNTISAKTLFLNELPIKILTAEKFIDSIKPIKNGFISNNFKNVFYTESENEWLDGAILSINNISNLKIKRLYLYCLYQACLMKRPFNLFHRANLNLRLNKVNRKFGNLTTWNSSFQDLMKVSLFELNNLYNINFTKKIKVLNSKNIEKISSGYDLVYLDPPYISKNGNSDNYLKRYHFLEGITNYEDWINKLNTNSKIKFYESNIVNKDWENKKIFKEKLFKLIKKHKKSIVVLSYMTNAIPSIKELSDFFEKNFSKVTICRYQLNHALVKNKRTEILIIGEP